LNQSIHINKMKNEYFVDNIIIYIEKRISERFSYIIQLLISSEYEKTLIVYQFFYNYNYIKLYIIFIELMIIILNI